MTMADAERKIQQLDNDVHAIYDILTKIEKAQGTHAERIESLQGSVSGIAATQMRHGNRLSELDAGLAGVSEQIKELRVTQMRHENRFTEIDQRFVAQDGKLDALGKQVDDRLDAHDKRFDTQDEKLDLIMKALGIDAN